MKTRKDKARIALEDNPLVLIWGNKNLLGLFVALCTIVITLLGSMIYAFFFLS